jgi:hypothetical protein
MATPSTSFKPGDLYQPADPLASPYQLDANPDPYSPPPTGEGFSMYQPDPNTRGTAIFDGTSGSGVGSAASASKQASLNGLLHSTASGSTTGVQSAGAPPVTMGDTSAGTAAAFARAKDQTGLNTRASLRAFQDQMAGNQMMGSGLEMTGTRDIVEHGAGQLNEVGREQAVKDAQMNNQRVMADYQGRVTQRGQDLNVAQSNANRQQQTLETLLSMIGGGVLY